MGQVGYLRGGDAMKNLFIKGLPDDLAKKIKVTAALRELKIRDLVIAALEAYLAAGRGK